MLILEGYLPYASVVSLPLHRPISVDDYETIYTDLIPSLCFGSQFVPERLG